MADVESRAAPWEKLFEQFDFFNAFKFYIQIECYCDGSEDTYHSWCLSLPVARVCRVDV
jgi:poly(A) polymerase Pap1